MKNCLCHIETYNNFSKNNFFFNHIIKEVLIVIEIILKYFKSLKHYLSHLINYYYHQSVI